MDVNRLSDARTKAFLLEIMFSWIEGCDIEPPDHLIESQFYYGLELLCFEIGVTIDKAIDELKSAPRPVAATA